jgi:hypothetical protein
MTNTIALQTQLQAQLRPVLVPPGSVPELHAFGDVLSVLLAGEQTGDAECAEEFAQPGGPDMQRIVETHQKYGIELLALPGA